MVNKRLLQLAAGSRSKFLLLVGLGVTGGILAVLQADYLARIINGVFLAAMDRDGAWPWLYMLLGIMVLRAVCVWTSGVLAHVLATEIKADIRQKLVGRLLAVGPVQVVTEETGNLVNLLTQGVDNLEPYFTSYLPQLATAVLIPILILTVVFPADYIVGCIMLITAPLIPLFMLLIGRAAENKNKRQWQTLSRLSAHFLDVLQGISTLKLFGRSREQIQVIARLSEQFRDATLGVLRIAFLSALVLELLSTVSIALVAVTVGLKLLYGKMDFFQAFFLLLLAPEFYLPIRLLGGHFHSGMAGKAAAEDIFRLMNQWAGKSTNQAGQPFPKQSVEISFQAVDFGYQPDQPGVIKGLSLHLPPGAKVALVGPNGAGKTTVVNLLLRFIAADGGRIIVNGMPIESICKEDWLRQVAFVPQFPYIFHGTVTDNIRLGMMEMELEGVIAAAKAAGAHEFIQHLPQGYQTVIGEGGIGLSGGECQRLAIARAFLRNASLLILDEATAGLDSRSEMIIRQAIERLMVGRTVLMIAHRLITVREADQIVFIDRGCLIEQGTHNELLAAGGRYAQMIAALGGSL